MTIDKYKRVMWRLKDKVKPGQRASILILRKAIMWEIGTDNRTIETAIKKLKELGWIERYCRFAFTITGEGEDEAVI